MKILFAVLALSAALAGSAQAGLNYNGGVPDWAKKSFDSSN